MDKVKLTETDKEAIKNWLKLRDKENLCPFERKRNAFPCELCEELFEQPLNDCPCGIFGTDVVVRKAKEWVK